MNNPDQVAFGQLGSDFVTGATDTATIPDGKVVVAITALADATLDTTGTVAESGFAVPTVAIPKGSTIFGRFTDVELDGGSVIVYFG